MEYDTGQNKEMGQLPLHSASDVSPQEVGSTTASVHPLPQTQTEQHASWSGKSKSISQSAMHNSIEASSHHGSDIVKYQRKFENDGWIGWVNGRDLQSREGSMMSNGSQISYTNTVDGQSIPGKEMRSTSNDNETSQTPSYAKDSKLFVQKGTETLTSSIVPSSGQIIMHEDEESMAMTNSNCVPVEGRLADLVDNDTSSETDESNGDEGGIVILNESTEEEFEESLLRESLESHDDSVDNALSAEQTQIGITQASMYQNDSIIQAVAARVNANPIPIDNASGSTSSLDFEQLMQEADNQNEIELLPEIEEEEENEDRIEEDAPCDAIEQNFWGRNLFSSFNKRSRRLDRQRRVSTIPATNVRHTPPRATRIRHDKYVVEIEIFPSADDASIDIRDVLDIMANIELLHLWFDPVPAVFDASIKDGSGNDISPSSTPSNSLEDGNSSSPRQYDGQWVEISTPLLSIPSDSRVTGCFRAIRIAFRSMIGFPARIRSMIFVERSNARIGMTLGPYPDGFLFQRGTMAYHTFNIRMSDEECGTAAESSRRCVVISDEVRLQRGDDDLDGTTRRRCCIVSLFRFILGFLEWIVLFRWYQPDLASYMQQTISSMEKLRILVERGEAAAYAGGGQLIVDGSDSEDENAMDTPLLGN